MRVMRALCCHMAVASALVWALGTPARAQEGPDRIRGEIVAMDGSRVTIKTREGGTAELELSPNVTVIELEPGSFTRVDFGIYVGSVAVRLDEYSPIVRDSLSWLHRGFELRIIDEQLRGIAVGHQKWDLTSDSIMAHGWVDDIEGRILSIKYGPTEEEETDVEVPRDAPVLKMSLGDLSLVKEGVYIVAGAQKSDAGKYTAVFVFAGKDGVKPPL